LTRTICVTPTFDSLPAVIPIWRSSGMVMVAGPAGKADTTPLTVHQFGRVGLTGSVWTDAVRRVYDLAVRRNRLLCTSLFAEAERRGAPPIDSCPR